MLKYSWGILLIIFPFFPGSACHKESSVRGNASIQNNGNENDDVMSNKISIKIGNKTFMVTLSDNATAASFKALLPITIKMTELNDNEKYFDLPGSLPTQASRPSSIQTGDLMLYGSRTVVLFYQTFSTTYSYTKIGHIDDPAGLAAGLGSGNVTVTFEIP